MDYIVGGYLLGLSVGDIKSKKLSIWVLLIGMAGSIVYAALYIGFAGIVLGLIPGILMIVLSILVPNSVGLGDGILAAIYGVLYGWRKTCIWLLLGFWVAAIVGIIWRFLRKESHICIPFVPFLAVVHVGLCL